MRKIIQIILLVFQNLFFWLLALILATTIWVVAISEEDPFEERAYPRAITIQMVGLADGLLLINDPLSQAAITLRTPASVWNTLVDSQVHIVADLTGLPPGEHSVSLNGSVDHPDVRVLRTEPGAIQIVLEQYITREMPISLRVIGEPAVGYSARAPRLTPETVAISGPATIVGSVNEITASVSITNMRDSLAQDINLRAVDSEGRAVPGLVFNSDMVQVSISIRQLGGYRDVAVRAQIEGQVAPGYRVTNIVTSPAIVTVFTEDLEVLETMPGFVETEVLDIADASDNVDAHLTLILPEGVSLVGEQAVQVQVGVSALISSLVLEPDIEVTGLAPNLEVTLSPETIVVIISGPVPVLDALVVEDVRVIVDLLRLRAGSYEIEPEVVVTHSDITVDAILPPVVQAELGIPPTPSEDEA